MNTFSKEERLCSKILIEDLMHNGSSFLCHPVRIQWKVVDRDGLPDAFKLAPAQVMINVPKKRFKKANKRNRIKRLIREAYRLNKQSLFYEQIQVRPDLLPIFMIGYISNEMADFKMLEQKVKQAIIKLGKNISTLPQDDK
jgi:ribonuclease P protein component